MMLIGTTFMRVATLSNLFMGTVLLPPAAAGGFLKRYDPEPLSVHIEMETAAAVARQREYTDNCGERCVNTLGWCPEGFVMLTADTKFPAYLVGGHTKYVPAGCVSASNATVKKVGAIQLVMVGEKEAFVWDKEEKKRGHACEMVDLLSMIGCIRRCGTSRAHWARPATRVGVN